jgi:hypothetical protein
MLSKLQNLTELDELKAPAEKLQTGRKLINIMFSGCLNILWLKGLRLFGKKNNFET